LTWNANDSKKGYEWAYFDDEKLLITERKNNGLKKE